MAIVAGARAETALPEGPCLLVGSLALGVPLIAKGGDGEARAVRKAEAVSWLDALDVEEWRVHRMPLLEAGPGLEVLVDGSRGPLVSRFQQGGTRGIALSIPADLGASTLPLDGRSRRPMRFSSVDLPQPDGPMMETKSPSATSSRTSESATVSMRSVR